MNSTPVILIEGFESGYEIEHLARIFLPGIPLATKNSTRGNLVYARKTNTHIGAGLRLGEQTLVCLEPINPEVPAKHQASRLLYNLFIKAGYRQPPWGMLTGVRPVHLLRRKMLEKSKAGAQNYFETYYGVSKEKFDLIHSVVNKQKPILKNSTKQSYSLYVSIPFCPSRCSYCSFISRDIERDKLLVDEYLTFLAKELEETATLAKELNLCLETIYIGGGTPTSLNEKQFEFLLQSIQNYFDTAKVKEYTVEAGRPDCTNYKKLELMKQYGVSRISINPQTLDDAVLQNIGRNHSSADILRCFKEAREVGHTNINMDLIAGLPGDTPEGFLKTLISIVALEPENITVHTLTLKRASNIVIDNKEVKSVPSEMITSAYPILAKAGYQPYYLYRQKSTVDNLENTGWALPGKEGLYNIFIMEEAHTILAVGAGASLKMVAQKQEKIERIYNFKYPVDYCANFPQVLEKKRGVREFYASYMDTETVG